MLKLVIIDYIVIAGGADFTRAKVQRSKQAIQIVSYFEIISVLERTWIRALIYACSILL